MLRAREGVGHLVSGVGGLRLAKQALFGCARQKIKKAKQEQGRQELGGIQQPGNAGASMQGEATTETLKMPR
jgi:hypothetical protein